MINLTNSVTITGESVTSVDPDTGTPTRTASAVMVDQPCAFTVLSAQQLSQSWGDDYATSGEAVAAHLLLPKWSPWLDQQYDSYKISVSGYSDSWRIVAARPGEQITTFLLSKI